MKLNIEIDDEMADRIVRKSLREQIDILNRQIEELESIEHLKSYQQEDLSAAQKELIFLTSTLEYYGGNVK
jgi:TolA-binding protein